MFFQNHFHTYAIIPSVLAFTYMFKCDWFCHLQRDGSLSGVGLFSVLVYEQICFGLAEQQMAGEGLTRNVENLSVSVVLHQNQRGY